MEKLPHFRWHIALAVGAAVLVERLHWHAVTVLAVGVLAERAGVGVWRRRGPRRRNAPSESIDVPDRSPAPRSAPTPRARRIELARLLDADCQSCHGHGCEVCGG